MVWRADGMGSTPVGRLRPKQVSAFLPDMFLITGCKASIRWGMVRRTDSKIESERDSHDIYKLMSKELGHV